MNSKSRAANKRSRVVAPLPTVTQQNDRLSRPFLAHTVLDMVPES